ncbi:outer membrane protein assembly factor BamB family protein [Paenibacillus sp. 481]|uniref:outer membrane protein assembly factor BamB family protein n=1 Tax=Paenibacillus sp. 481 TaxID=2835869 RepID=UPI001E449E6B|nr:PQQ-binding-like beta-propeller repeat protein [Paenibacillus sp. 481]UHA73218.1 PQQ-binding-like beta-propeller repeat protein [Paenibacillus sp. 481]
MNNYRRFKPYQTYQKVLLTWIAVMITGTVIAPSTLSAEAQRAAQPPNQTSNQTLSQTLSQASSTAIPNARIAWSVNTGKLDHFAVGDGKVFLLQQGQLVAMDTKKGNRLWKYGSQLQSSVVYKEGYVYVTSTGGSIYAVDVRTGKKSWEASVKLKDIRELRVDGDHLYTISEQINAYHVKNGRLVWKNASKIADARLDGFVSFTKDRVLTNNIVSGATTMSQFIAYDRQTGKEVWSLRERYPVQVHGSSIILQSMYGSPLLPTLEYIDARTGKVLKTKSYNPLQIDTAKFPPSERYSLHGNIYMDGHDVFVAIDSSVTDQVLHVYHYSAGADPLKPATNVYKPFGKHMKSATLDEIVDGQIIFRDQSALYSFKLNNKAAVYYRAINRGQLASIYVIEHLMFALHTDGTLIALDVNSGMPLLRLQTNGLQSPPVIADGSVLILMKNKFVVIKKPKIETT